MRRRSAEQSAPTAAQIAARRASLSAKIAEIESVLRQQQDDVEPQDQPEEQFRVVIGTSADLKKRSSLADEIVEVINSAYYESLKEILDPRCKTYERVDRDDVIDRLQMGDEGIRANRVLHLAYKDDVLVGACSSTFQPPWTEEGCGHWGLLSVAPAHQGTGVASALIRVAEKRLATTCVEIQIEYEYTEGHDYSQRLMSWYEGKLGFKCKQGYNRGARGTTTFRKCRKRISEEEIQKGQRRRTMEIHAFLTEELRRLPA